MGRTSGRSRGCQECIQRKLKCDESFPECSCCRICGRKCPGALRGTLFVDMSEKTRNKFIHRKSDKRETITQCSKSFEFVQETIGEDLHIKPPCPIAGSPQSTPPNSLTRYQPNDGAFYQKLFVEHFDFASKFEPVCQPWLAELPNLLSTHSDSAQVFAIRATTMAVYGRYHNDRSLEMQSIKWYWKGIQRQRKNLHRNLRTEEHYAEAICSAMMFALLETMIPTSPQACAFHSNAARKMLLAAGPDMCQNGLMHMIFRSSRIEAFISPMILQKPSMLSSEPWLTVPFLKQPKGQFDTLIDILLTIPCEAPLAPEANRLQPQNANELNIRRDIAARAQDALQQLDKFWRANKSTIDPAYYQRLTELQLTYRPPISTSPIHSPIAFLDCNTAFTTSLYDTGRIVCLSHASFSPSTEDEIRNSITAHSFSILASLSCHENNVPAIEGTFSKCFPVNIVRLRALDQGIRERATEALIRYGTPRRFNDLIVGEEKDRPGEGHRIRRSCDGAFERWRWEIYNLNPRFSLSLSDHGN